jgi:ABC-type phosphate transport system substrate-binding protein
MIAYDIQPHLVVAYIMPYAQNISSNSYVKSLMPFFPPAVEFDYIYFNRKNNKALAGEMSGGALASGRKHSFR